MCCRGFPADADFARVGYAGIHTARANYVTVQLGADRVQTIHKDWSVKLHADGQWANGALDRERTIRHGRRQGRARLHRRRGLRR